MFGKRYQGRHADPLSFLDQVELEGLRLRCIACADRIDAHINAVVAGSLGPDDLASEAAEFIWTARDLLRAVGTAGGPR